MLVFYCFNVEASKHEIKEEIFRHLLFHLFKTFHASEILITQRKLQEKQKP